MLNQHISSQIFIENQKYSRNKLHLYTLIDGLEYERFFQEEIIENEWIKPLFLQPSNKDMAFAGPWICYIKKMNSDFHNQIIELEQKYPSVSWIISSLSFEYLLNNLENKLHITLEDNRYALLRYYDPRVLYKLPSVLTEQQIKTFTLQIDEWIYYYENNYYSLNAGKL